MLTVSLRFLLPALLAGAMSAGAATNSWISWQPDTATGSSGNLKLVARLPGQKSPASVIVSQKGKPLDTLSLTMGSDSLFRDTLAFRQGKRPATNDTLWLASTGRATDSLVATFTSGSTILRDTARIYRPALKISMIQKGIKDSIEVTLSAGAQPDSKGHRTLLFQAGNVSSLSMTLAGLQGDTSLTALLSSTSKLSWIRGEAWIKVRFIDPVYADTATDSILVAMPQRSITILSAKDTLPTFLGPRGSFLITATDPWETRDTLTIQLTSPNTSGTNTLFTLKLPREGAATFRTIVPVTQAATATKDTLVLGPAWPAGANARVVVTLPERAPMFAAQDTAWILRPPLSLKLAHLTDSNAISVALNGGFPDGTGNAKVVLQCAAATNGPRSLSLTSGDSLHWSASTSFKNQLEEWSDSASLIGTFTDPLYGDVVRDTIKLWAPWFPASLSLDRFSANPREKDIVTIRLTEHDPDTAKVDTFRVTTPSGKTIHLIETGPHTGIFSARVVSSELDESWMLQRPRTSWRLDIRYQDPKHPADTVHTSLAMEFDVPFFEMGLRNPIFDRSSGGSSSNPAHSFGIEPVKQIDTAFARSPDAGQGMWLRAWDRTLVDVYIYDNLGILVTKWIGEVDPKNGDRGALYLLRWDGRGDNGRPAPSGVYFMRMLARRFDGVRALNYIHHIGLK